MEKKNTNWICVTYQIRQLEYSYSIAAQTNTLTSKWARSSSKLSYFFGENYTFAFCWIFLYDFCAGTGPFHTCAHFKGHPKGRESFHPFLTSTQDVWNSDCGKSNINWYRKGVTKNIKLTLTENAASKTCQGASKWSADAGQVYILTNTISQS